MLILAREENGKGNVQEEIDWLATGYNPVKVCSRLDLEKWQLRESSERGTAPLQVLTDHIFL